MVSVIVPVYNTGKVLNKCLRSVVQQTYTDWECIVVNDCSTDTVTMQVLEKWRKCSSKFIFIDKPVNEGVDMARFSALAMAKGDYVTFVDSDDWLEPHALEVMLAKSIETDADVVVGRMRKVYLGGLFSKSDISTSEWIEKVISHDELMEKYYISFFGVNILPVNVCAFMCRRSLFQLSNAKPSGLKFGEDLILHMNLFPHIKRYYAIDKIVYNYRHGLPGISDKYLDSWLENARKLYEIKMQVLRNANYEKGIYYQKIELVNYIKSYINTSLRYRQRQREKNIDVLQKELSYPIYKDLATLIDTQYKDASFAILIANGKADECYSIMEQNAKMMPIKQKIVNCILGLLHKWH
ncbi:MAG: glycosyltransferase family 2 protein [Prevotellaceae bacterium]|nr:glycosyltransferase family 2 protein [Prevotellaceae bacterium]